jgi:hypothetical protein
VELGGTLPLSHTVSSSFSFPLKPLLIKVSLFKLSHFVSLHFLKSYAK